MKNEKTLLPNLGLAPFCKSRGMTLQIAQLQQLSSSKINQFHPPPPPPKKKIANILAPKEL